MASFPSPPFPAVGKKNSPIETVIPVGYLPPKPNSLYWLIKCRNCGHARHWHGSSGAKSLESVPGTGCTRQHSRESNGLCKCAAFYPSSDLVVAEFA